MGAELDRLEIAVEAQATKANNQLDKLVGNLDRVASSLMNINHGGLSGLASGVNKFALASSQLNNVKTADFTRLAKNIQGLSSIKLNDAPFWAGHSTKKAPCLGCFL